MGRAAAVAGCARHCQDPEKNGTEADGALAWTTADEVAAAAGSCCNGGSGEDSDFPGCKGNSKGSVAASCSDVAAVLTDGTRS